MAIHGNSDPFFAYMRFRVDSLFDLVLIKWAYDKVGNNSFKVFMASRLI